MRIFLIGFMGCGKTHWGKQLAALLKIPFIDLDQKIEENERQTVSEIFSENGEEYFRMAEKQMLDQMIDENVSMVLSVGGGTPCFFNNIDLMKKKGTVVWLNTHVDLLLQRLLNGKQERPLIRDLSDHELKSYIVKKLNERKMYYEQANVVIDNESSITPSQFIQTILHA